jgi:hypothetical protein
MIRAFMDLLLHEVHQSLQLDDTDWTLLARLEQTIQDLVPVEFFPAAILLDDHVRDFVDSFVTGETTRTVQTLASAAD